MAIAAMGAALLIPSRSFAQVTYHTLLEFSGVPAGGGPSGVTAGPNGVLYSMTGGGAFGEGAVVELQPPASGTGPWTQNVLYSFTGQDGDGGTSQILSPLVVAPDGNIYGTTSSGGAYGGGIVFELQPPASSGGDWTETILYDLALYDDSIWQFASMVTMADGRLYGVSPAGGIYNNGLVFELRAPPGGSGAWSSSVLYTFTGTSDGAYPDGLTVGPDGVLYGTALGGGDYGQGVVFALQPPAVAGDAWSENVLYSFQGEAAGSAAFGPPLILKDGSLLGTTQTTLFELTPPAAGETTWTETRIFGFGPDSTLVLHNGSVFFTISSLFCSYYCSGGVVYQLQPSQSGGSWTATALKQFNGNEEPFGSLVIDSHGWIFGTTLYGPGFLGSGILYAIKP